MQPIAIPGLDDPRIAHYRNLRDRVLRKDGNRFIIEGLRLLERAADAGIRRESVLTEPRQLDAVRPFVGPETRVYLVDREQMTRVAGLAIHTGVLSVGLRPPPLDLDGLVGRAERAAAPPLLLVAPHIKETANLGALIRVAAAFGAHGLVIGPACCDPFYRRAVRVSMGAAFTLPIVRSDDLPHDLQRLRDAFGFTLAATVLDRDAVALAEVAPPPRLALVLGHEVDGLPRPLVDLCAMKLTIPMAEQTDSLNVSISAAVFLYHFTQAPPPPPRRT